MIAQVQTDPALTEVLNRIAIAQTILAVVALALVLAAGIGVLLSIVSAE